MGLTYDVARCAGTTHDVCQVCRRREPGNKWQWYIAPSVDVMTGQCSDFIEPPRIYANSNTVPNACGEPGLTEPGKN